MHRNVHMIMSSKKKPASPECSLEMGIRYKDLTATPSELWSNDSWRPTLTLEEERKVGIATWEHTEGNIQKPYRSLPSKCFEKVLPGRSQTNVPSQTLFTLYFQFKQNYTCTGTYIMYMRITDVLQVSFPLVKYAGTVLTCQRDCRYSTKRRGCVGGGQRVTNETACLSPLGWDNKSSFWV